MRGRVKFLFAVVSVIALGCTPGDDSRSGKTPDGAGADAVAIAPFAPLPEAFHRGMNIEPIGGYGGQIDLRALPGSLDALVKLKVDHVALIPSFFQRRLGDSEFYWKGSRQRIASDTRAAIAVAHERGLQVLLKPHLWLEDRADGAWRGDIDPDAEAWEPWQRSYRDAVLEYARLGADTGVAALSIGSELTNVALAHPDFWRQLASEVREDFPGQVTYAANWDREFAEITWWDAVDAIGVDAFWPLAESADEVLTPELCVARLGAIRDRIGAIAAANERPVILTEVGYKSATGAAYQPWEWHERRQRPDPQLQALLYDCIGRVFGAAASGTSAAGDDAWLSGVYFWNWYTSARWGGLANSDFTPRGKPAERVLHAWFKAGS